MQSSKYSFYKSYFSGTLQVHPVLFHHLPKCGGMSIYAMASAAWKMMCQVNELPPPIVDRCDDEASENNLRNAPYTFIATHLPFGLHRRLSGTPMLMTVLRNPLQRLCSAYGYHCIRNGKKVETSDIPTFVNDNINMNLMTKLLSGKQLDQEATPDDLVSVIERLSVDFDFVSTTADIPAISESFLQRFGLPNIITTHINSTPSEFKLDITNIKEQIHAANALDFTLFEAFCDRGPILPPFETPSNSLALHPLTVVMAECGDENASLFWGTLIKTERIFTEGLIQEDGKPNSEALDLLIQSARSERKD